LPTAPLKLETPRLEWRGPSGNPPEFRQRDEDDPGGRVQLGRRDLNHRHIALAQLENATTGTRGRVVDGFDKLDPIKGSKFA
jgi:hypothetical protein